MLADAIKAEARRVGFDLVGIARAQTPPGVGALDVWLERGYSGVMTWFQRHRHAYEHPRFVLDGAQSLIMVAMNYKPPEPLPQPGPLEGRVSCYAAGARDYHEVLKEKLNRLAGFLHAQRPGCHTRCAVDTAPLLEREFAQLAGLGWIGKNTMLINKRLGSWLFLGALLVDIPLADVPSVQTDHCGTCTRCLEACPTQAFPEPGVLDARKCLSYLTIELRDEPVPAEWRRSVGNWLFGCDICQQVCPWNRKASVGSEAAFEPRSAMAAADAIGLLSLSEAEFRGRFRHTALWRARRAGLLRNAAIVLGNHGDERALAALERALNDDEPLVRGAAAWALGRFQSPEAFAALKLRQSCEDNESVRYEIAQALHCEPAEL